MYLVISMHVEGCDMMLQHEPLDVLQYELQCVYYKITLSYVAYGLSYIMKLLSIPYIKIVWDQIATCIAALRVVSHCN